MSKKILLIEDEQHLAEMYKIKFEHEGYKVIIAQNGEQGIEAAINEQPDLILLDLVMPKMDGYDVLTKLRSDNKTKKIKTYILSNLGQDEEIDRGFKNGANGYFIKSSLTPAQLVQKVKKIFNGETVGIKPNNILT